MQNPVRRVLTAVLATALTAFMAIPVLPAHAAEVDDIATQTQSARDQLTAIQEETERVIDDYDGCVEAQNRALDGMLEAQSRIDQTQAEIDTVQNRLMSRAKAMYRSDDATYLAVLTGTESFQDFIDKWDTLNTLNEDDAALVSQAKNLQSQAREDKEEYARLEQQAASQMMAASNAKTAVEAQYETYSATLNSYSSDVQEAVIQQIKDENEQASAASDAALEKYIDNGGTVPKVGGTDSGSSSSSGGSATAGDDEDDDDSGSSSSGGGSSSSGGSSGGSSIPSNGSVVSYAYSRLGCPYVWGADGPSEFDCSGLTSWCYSQVGISIPRTSGGQLSGASAVMDVSAAEPGDILWKNGHVGIYVGDGAYIHAPTEGENVCVAYNMDMWTYALRY